MFRRGIFLVMFLILISAANAQRIQGGLLFGGNASQVDGDRIYGFYKFGWNVGATAIIPVYKTFSVNTEILYSQKGSYQYALSADSINGAYKLVLNYAEAPIYLNYYDPRGKISIGTGLAYGRVVKFREWIYNVEKKYAASEMPYNKSNIDWFINAYYPIYRGLKLNLRYSYSIAKIRDREFSDGGTRKQYHNFITLRIMYIFGEKPPMVEKMDEIK